jgi:hypothetical protein
MHLMHSLFLTWTQKSHYIHSSYITIFTQHIVSHPTKPLTFHNIPCFTYLENQLLFSWWRIPIHPCPWSANNCPTLCFSPLTLSHPPQFKLHYLHRWHQQPRSSSSGIIHTKIYFCSCCYISLSLYTGENVSQSKLNRKESVFSFYFPQQWTIFIILFFPLTENKS